MRRILSNKVYDTATAVLVGSWDDGLDCTDSDHVEESLYRKKTGEYFLHGEGGPRSPYAQRRGDRWALGEALSPVSFEGAREWAGRHLGTEAYEAEFGTPEEGDALISARVSAACKALIDRRRSQTGETIAEIIEKAVMAL